MAIVATDASARPVRIRRFRPVLTLNLHPNVHIGPGLGSGPVLGGPAPTGRSWPRANSSRRALAESSCLNPP